MITNNTIDLNKIGFNTAFFICQTNSLGTSLVHNYL